MLADAIGGKGSDSTPEPRQGLRGAEATLQVAFQRLQGEATQILRAPAGKRFGSKAGRGSAKHAERHLPGVGEEPAGIAAAMHCAEKAVCVLEPYFRRLQGFATFGAVRDIG